MDWIRAMARLSGISVLIMASVTATAAEEYGIFELIHRSDQSYADTSAAVAAALERSDFVLHASHEVRVPGDQQHARVFVLTSPSYQSLAADESPRTVSAQVLRVAVYTWGEDQETLINMANPVAHAMVYYAKSDNYDNLVAAAKATAADIRSSLADLSGETVSVQQEPQRSEKHYRNYKGDGPARMMAKFRTYQKSQLSIEEFSDQNVTAVSERVAAALDRDDELDASKPIGWEPLVQIRFSDDVTYFGISNPYLEDKMIRINSRFRSEGKSDSAPYPGTDHVAALPTDVLVVNEGGVTKVLHYGQMWRMQLYFWDSGYRAFAANVGVPGAIANSIEALLSEAL